MRAPDCVTVVIKVASTRMMVTTSRVRLLVFRDNGLFCAEELACYLAFVLAQRSCSGWAP